MDRKEKNAKFSGRWERCLTCIPPTPPHLSWSDTVGMWNYLGNIPWTVVYAFKQKIQETEYQSDDVTKMIFLKLWDMMSYSSRASYVMPSYQKLALNCNSWWRYKGSKFDSIPYKPIKICSGSFSLEPAQN